MSGMNGYQGQIRAEDQTNGYFPANMELMDLIEQECNDLYPGYITRIGINTRPAMIGIENDPADTGPIYVRLNNESYEIGQTGFYQANDVHISSIQFEEDSSRDTIIDFII